MVNDELSRETLFHAMAAKGFRRGRKVFFNFAMFESSPTPGLTPALSISGETERETLKFFSTIFIYSAFSWLESGEGGQGPDEVKCGADSLVVRKILLAKSQSV